VRIGSHRLNVKQCEGNSGGYRHQQTTAFTYQGRLTDGGNPASGNYDLQFALFDSSSAGVQISSTLTRSSVAVGGGVFSLMNQMRV
jgi:hypothetical protein